MIHILFSTSLRVKPLLNDHLWLNTNGSPTILYVHLYFCRLKSGSPSLYCIYYSKTVPWLSPIHKEGNELCFIHTIKYEGTTFTSRVHVLNENTVKTEGIQITLYFIMSSLSLVKYCFFNENMVCINSTVNVKQKQM